MRFMHSTTASRALIAAIGCACTCAAASGRAALTGGQLDVSSSWFGTPDSGYDNASNSDTVVHGPTTGAIAYSSNPLSLAHNYIFDHNANGVRFVQETGMNWGGTVVGPRHFTFSSTMNETLTLTATSDWTRALTISPVLGQFAYYWLEDQSNTLAPIDLLTVSSGTLPAGAYRLRSHVSAEWDDSGLSFLHVNVMTLELTVVPAPATAAAAGAALFTGRRRRRL